MTSESNEQTSKRPNICQIGKLKCSNITDCDFNEKEFKVFSFLDC